MSGGSKILKLKYCNLFTTKKHYDIIKDKINKRRKTMNQILFENEGIEKVGTKKIIRFFCIAIIIFGVALLGGGVYGIMQENAKKAPVSRNKPSITVSVFEEDSIRIYVTHDKAIDRIVYSWNDGEDITILGRNRESIEELIDMPLGENVLHLRVIDEIGIEETYTNTYVYSENGVDIQKPTIELSVLEKEKQIKITAKDETEISYITYRWNNEEETRIDVTDESKTIIETNISIPRGDNDLTVVAVDSNNNMETKIQKCKAYTRPVIKTPRQFGQNLTITVTDEEGLDYVEYTINGKKYKWVSSTEDRKEWTHVQPLEPGENEVVIEAWNKAGIQAVSFRGKCKYTP